MSAFPRVKEAFGYSATSPTLGEFAVAADAVTDWARASSAEARTAKNRTKAECFRVTRR